MLAEIAEVSDNVLMSRIKRVEFIANTQPFGRGRTGKFREQKMLGQMDISHTGLKNKTTKIFIRTTN